MERLLGLAYLQTGNPEQAAKVLSRPADAEGHYYLGVALGQQGELAAAIHEFKTANALKPNFGPAHESLGLALRRQGNRAEALREFQLAARWMPKNAVTLCDLGTALKDAGRLSEAEEALRSALALKPDFERARYTLGIVLRLRGESSAATKEMQQVRASHEQRTADAQSQKMIIEGTAALKAGRLDDAKAAFESAASLSPASPPAYYLGGLTEKNSVKLSTHSPCMKRRSP